MTTAKAIQLYLAEGNLNGILTIQEPAGWGAGILVSSPRQSIDQLFQRPEVNNAGIYFLLSEKRVYIGQSQSSIKSRLNQHEKNKSWWNRVIFLTKTDNSLSSTDVQYMEVEFIRLAKKANTADTDNRNHGNQNGYISEFARAANDQFINEAVLLLEVIGIKVFSAKNKLATTKKIANKQKIMSKDHGYRFWHPEISEMTFHYQTKNGGDAQMKWISEDEYVLLAGSKLGNTITDNKSGITVKKLRMQYKDRIIDDQVMTDLIFTTVNPTSSLVKGGAANAWTCWKNEENKTLDTIVRELQSKS